MATVQSDYAKGTKAMPSPVGGEVINLLIALPVTAAQTAANDIYEMGYLPENCSLVDCAFASTDLDTNGTPAMVASFGILNSGATDLDGTALQASLTIGQAGTATSMTKTVTTLTTTCNGSTRKKLGYKVTTAAATGAAGTVYLSLSYRAATLGL